jgi:ATP-dependent Clp protease ATP-binding subunit ClpA
MSSESSTSASSDSEASFNKKFDEMGFSKKKGVKKRRITVSAKKTFCISNSENSEESDDDIDYCEKLKSYNKFNPTRKINIPWTEKYRPTRIEDLVIDKYSHEKISRILEEKTMANIIFSGSPGIGKTSTMCFLAKSLLGKYYDDGVIELNASDERGVKTVQDIIEYFCKRNYF